MQGPRGPPGYNGTNGLPGQPGPRGYNGTQGPSGSSRSYTLSLCSYEETKSASIKAHQYASQEVSATEPNVSLKPNREIRKQTAQFTSFRL